MATKFIPCLIRFRNESLHTLNQIDTIANEYNLSRADAIRMVFEYCQKIDPSFANPLSQSPRFIN
jgi:hypothetical protein